MSIKHIYAFVGAGENDGIIAIGNEPEKMIPMVCIEEETLKHMRPLVESVARKTGKNILILKFSVCEQIGEIQT